MPVGIMQVLNNTSKQISYNNLESGHTFTVAVMTEQYYNNSRIPSSNTKDDTVPWYDANRDDKHIDIKVGTQRIQVSERDGHFYLDYDTGGAHYRSSLGDDLTNGGQYVLRFDVAEVPSNRKEVALTIYKYRSNLETSAGYIKETALHQVSALGAMVLLGIYL